MKKYYFNTDLRFSVKEEKNSENTKLEGYCYVLLWLQNVKKRYFLILKK